MNRFVSLVLIACLSFPLKAEEDRFQGEKALVTQFSRYHDLLTLKLNEVNRSSVIPDEVKFQISAQIKEKIDQLQDIYNKIEALGLLQAEDKVEHNEQTKSGQERAWESRQNVREKIEYLETAVQKEQADLHRGMDEFLEGIDQFQKNISSFKTEKFAKALNDILTTAMERISTFIQKLKEQ